MAVRFMGYPEIIPQSLGVTSHLLSCLEDQVKLWMVGYVKFCCTLMDFLCYLRLCKNLPSHVFDLHPPFVKLP